ncbi:MAG: S8 family serine peptidase [candidate division KSB1 bacterium]|nr:S8 family serine peptidase [candidate division KSB1 bacterium]MDZ7369306.1 S8 family serine peptidase [candidate division KSB1 bacterium]MDZ7407351.1 S8 family serine peptidase [candidate division KSB1 bacterium]
MSSKRLLLLITGILFMIPIISENAVAAERQKYWIFFRDKGPLSLSKRSAMLDEAKHRLSPKALERRAKVLPENALVDESDLDLYKTYLNELTGRGFEPVVTSRWLNAVSIFATPEEVAALQNLPFIKNVQRVAHLAIPPAPETVPELPALFKTTAHRFEYGNSLAQMEQIKATILHDAGIYGIGVIVGMMDSGFRWQDHEAFVHLRSKIIGERDFIQNDNVTRNQTGDAAGQDSHGTQTLSTLGGFKPGQLIGPGFGARFILAKTEHVPTETHAEEDYWAAAVEWMESLGVDVTSTSLGYSEFDAGQTSYTQANMDGKTAIITKAAEMAASKGVIVVNSAGNEGNVAWRIIVAPADGPNVIAVGAVFSNGGIVGFSSRGPTADRRIKPDVMAMGSGVRAVSPASTNQYTFVSGTSFSCPLVGGVVAQILSAHPETTPQQMMNALRSTASMANAPNNDFGYGIVNAKAAITSLGPAFSNEPEISAQSGTFTVTMRILSRDGIAPGSVRIFYANRGSNTFNSAVMAPIDSTGYVAQIPRPTQLADTMRVYFSANDLGFGAVNYPKRAPQKTILIRGDGLVLNVNDPPPPLPTKFVLEPNLPNPFGGSAAPRTRIAFELPNASPVRIRVFNILGQRVRTLFDGDLPAGQYRNFFWDGTDDRRQPVAGGVYFYEVSTALGTGRNKMLLLR